MAIIVEGQPVPQFRMNIRSKWNPKSRKSLDYQQAIAWSIIASKMKPLGDSIVEVEASFYRQGNQKCDLDNLLKSLIDGIQYSKIINNDNQVRKIKAEVYYGQERPRTEFTIRPENNR